MDEFDLHTKNMYLVPDTVVNGNNTDKINYYEHELALLDKSFEALTEKQKQVKRDSYVEFRALGQRMLNSCK